MRLDTIFLLLAFNKVLPVTTFILISTSTTPSKTPLLRIAAQHHVDIQCSTELDVCLPQTTLLDGRHLMERLQQQQQQSSSAAVDVGSSEILATNTNAAHFEKDVSSIRDSLTQDAERRFQLQEMEINLRIAQVFADQGDLALMKKCFQDAEKYATAAHVNDAAFYEKIATIQHSFGKEEVEFLRKADKDAKAGDRELMEYELRLAKESSEKADRLVWKGLHY